MIDDDPHYHGHRQRLRERFRKSGLAGFADYEVVELLLTLAIPRSDVKQPAKALVARFGNLRGILDAPIEELRMRWEISSMTGNRRHPARDPGPVWANSLEQTTVI